MHKVEAHEPTNEFLEMWYAAGRHLNEQVDGGIQAWLKSDPKPPWLEHLSFRLGNQLFFVRVIDQSGLIEIPGNEEGVQIVSQKCGGHACVLPMKKTFFGSKWQAVHKGWGLLDSQTGKAINPVELITGESIEISDWELNDIAVQVVREQIVKDGYRLTGWVSNPDIDPAIWFIGASGKPEWVVVRAARYPCRSAPLPKNINDIAEHFSYFSTAGHFASVAIASADDVFDPTAAQNGNFSPILRGHGFVIGYQGLVAYSHSDNNTEKATEMTSLGLIDSLFDECIQWHLNMANEHHAVPRTLTGINSDGQQFRVILDGLHLNHLEIAGLIKTALMFEEAVAYSYSRLVGSPDGTVELEVISSSSKSFICGFLPVTRDSSGEIFSLNLNNRNHGNDPENYPGAWFLTDAFKVTEEDVLRYRELWLAIRLEAKFQSRSSIKRAQDTTGLIWG
jgi:hypothetical protein